MRTTIDLPDELYRSLKTRAAIQGVTLREVVQSLIEQALREGDAPLPRSSTRPAPPMIIPASGAPVRVTRADIDRLEEAEDLERHGRPAGR